jgi:hypothetical protein
VNDPHDSLDLQLTRLRTLVASVELEVVNLETTDPQAQATPLRAAWSSLVKAMLLGPEPELRSCPACARSIMVDASRCRYCWQRSETTK